MAKHDRRKRSSQPRSSRTVTIQVPLPVLGVLNGVREAFHGLCIKTGMQVLEAMMEGDREDLCGPKGRHQAERPAWRGGNVASQVTLGGRQVGLSRSLLNFASGGLPVSAPRSSILRHVSNRTVGRGQRVQGADQVAQVAVAPHPPEARLRLHQRARHPALNHLAAAPP